MQANKHTKKKKEIPISLIYSAKPKIRGQMKEVKMLQSLEESDLELQSISFFAVDKERKLVQLLEPLDSGHEGQKSILACFSYVVCKFESSGDCIYWSIFLNLHLLKGLLTISLCFLKQHKKHKLMSHHFSSLSGKLNS